MDAAITISKRNKPAPQSQHLTVGALIFPRLDQIDFTGPFEVLSRIPDSSLHVIAKTKSTVRDIRGLILTPEMSIAEAAELDVLLVPGGFGQHELMNDEEVLSLIRNHFTAGKLVGSQPLLDDGVSGSYADVVQKSLLGEVRNSGHGLPISAG